MKPNQSCKVPTCHTTHNKHMHTPKQPTKLSPKQTPQNTHSHTCPRTHTHTHNKDTEFIQACTHPITQSHAHTHAPMHVSCCGVNHPKMHYLKRQPKPPIAIAHWIFCSGMEQSRSISLSLSLFLSLDDPKNASNVVHICLSKGPHVAQSVGD